MSRTATELETETHGLYRFWDSAGRLLYVGISVNPLSRFDQHRAEKPWWDDIASVTIERYPNRSEVLDAEREAIRSEKPAFNVTHNTSRPTRARAQSAPRGTRRLKFGRKPVRGDSVGFLTNIRSFHRGAGKGWEHVYDQVRGVIIVADALGVTITQEVHNSVVQFEWHEMEMMVWDDDPEADLIYAQWDECGYAPLHPRMFA
jgi:hypothetical protein